MSSFVPGIANARIRRCNHRDWWEWNFAAARPKSNYALHRILISEVRSWLLNTMKISFAVNCFLWTHSSFVRSITISKIQLLIVKKKISTSLVALLLLSNDLLVSEVWRVSKWAVKTWNSPAMKTYPLNHPEVNQSGSSQFRRDTASNKEYLKTNSSI